MRVTRNKIRQWLRSGTYGAKNPKYMLVHRDTFSNDYWRSYAEDREDAKKQIDDAREDTMHSIKEVYCFEEDLEEQVESRNCWRL